MPSNSLTINNTLSCIREKCGFWLNTENFPFMIMIKCLSIIQYKQALDGPFCHKNPPLNG